MDRMSALPREPWHLPSIHLYPSVNPEKRAGGARKESCICLYVFLLGGGLFVRLVLFVCLFGVFLHWFLRVAADM